MNLYCKKCNIKIKGYWYKGSKEKFKLFKKLYPNIQIKIISKKYELEGGTR